MKYSYSWLRELSQTQKTPQKLAYQLMMQGFELEEMEQLEKRFENFVVGEILQIEKHFNANKLKKVLVDIGKKKLSIVCGAPNVRVGMLVAVALVGAVVPKNKIKIEKRKVRGEFSEGMLCSEDELMLGKDASGIMELEKGLTLGKPLAEALGLKDWILDLKVLPNRAHDCLSHWGMAREIIAGENRRGKIFQEEKIFLKKKEKLSPKRLKVFIEDFSLCPRYLAGFFSGVKIGQSPNWIRSRLIACGMEPINNVVDITNLVMLETGNPLHAFDGRRIEGKSILVRRAQQGEKLKLLGDKFLTLTSEDLVIADGKKALALAGIKGGQQSGIDRDTEEIILEAACFNPFSIRKTRQRHNLMTESQSRFEKGLSAVLAEKAFLRAQTLLEKYAGAKLLGWVEEKIKKEKKWELSLERSLAEKLLGEKIAWNLAEKILENLGFIITKKSKAVLKVLVPDWRLDIEGAEDLVEEIGRIMGYEKICAQPLQFLVGSSKENFSRRLEWKMKDCLTGLGFDEISSYSFYGQKDILIGELNFPHWELENTLSPEQAFFRQTLLTGLFSAAALNRSYFGRFNLFELGRVYKKDAEDSAIEELKVAGLVFDKEKNERELFYFLKGKLESFLKNFLTEKIDWISEKKVQEQIFGRGFFQSMGLTEIRVNNQKIGVLGLASDKVAKYYGFKEKVASFEIDFFKIEKMFLRKKLIFQALDKFPSVKRDLSLFVPWKVEVAEVERIILSSDKKFLKKLELFDIFEDQKGRKRSLAFHLEFNHPERTLTSNEVDERMEKILIKLKEEGFEVRC